MPLLLSEIEAYQRARDGQAFSSPDTDTQYTYYPVAPVVDTLEVVVTPDVVADDAKQRELKELSERRLQEERDYAARLRQEKIVAEAATAAATAAEEAAHALVVDIAHAEAIEDDEERSLVQEGDRLYGMAIEHARIKAEAEARRAQAILDQELLDRQLTESLEATILATAAKEQYEREAAELIAAEDLQFACEIEAAEAAIAKAIADKESLEAHHRELRAETSDKIASYRSTLRRNQYQAVKRYKELLPKEVPTPELAETKPTVTKLDLDPRDVSFKATPSANVSTSTRSFVLKGHEGRTVRKVAE
ncbi:hypothetical protein H7Y63_00135 [Polaromonas sp.]|nr:hypothetical protein [Candidatus Saccharibacteria bacterium]